MILATDDKCQEQRWCPGVARPPADTRNHAAETEVRLPLDMLCHSLPNVGFQSVPPLGRTVAILQKVKDTCLSDPAALPVGREAHAGCS